MLKREKIHQMEINTPQKIDPFSKKASKFLLIKNNSECRCVIYIYLTKQIYLALYFILVITYF